MSPRRGISVWLIGTATVTGILIIVAGLIVFPEPKMPLALAFVCLTNAVPEGGGPIWSAYNKDGNVSDLARASPSHVLFALRNRTGQPITYRFLMYQFTDTLPAGSAPPKGPYRRHGDPVNPPGRPGPDLGVSDTTRFGRMRFGPPDCFSYRTLIPRGTVYVALPRPPFDCVWRPVITYICPLSKRDFLVHQLKSWLRLKDDRWLIHSAQGGRAYDEYAAWLTNTAVLHGDAVQPTEADPDAPAASMGSQPVHSPR